MRVLLMSSSSGSLGGGEQYLIELGRGLATLGMEVATGMSDHARMDALDSACSSFGKVMRVPYRNTYDRLLRVVGAVLARPTIGRFKAFFRAVRPDLVHVNKQNVEDGLDLLLAAKQARIPTVATIHIARSMTELQSHGGFLRDKVATGVLRRSPAHFITVARHCSRQLLVSCPGLDPRRVHSVWNGVACAPEADRQAIRAEWGCRPGDLVLGCVARLEQQKDPLFVLELLAQLPEQTKLVWVGDGRLRDDFARATARHNLVSRVHAEGWRADARRRLAGFDVFLLPSEYEGFPFAVLEAMAAGLPCVVSDVDGTREAVIDGETGFLCRSKDQAQWLARLGVLLGDPGMRERMGRQALERMRLHFSLEAMAAGTAAVYEHVLGRTEASVH
ncbi:MAG TPA: glycosyltransferase family 4 protein [Gemmataceae bacterium]|jgi:glycosyltransferase involved in cell wall biosynthesis|nr:glycosyltransferase family 4 protein [Gemmataceae bacterium]